jgi:hypothetical protein
MIPGAGLLWLLVAFGPARSGRPSSEPSRNRRRARRGVEALGGPGRQVEIDGALEGLPLKAHITIAVFLVGFAGGLLTAVQKQASPALPAGRVTGIGGDFFKAKDPKALSAWYRDKLGVPVTAGAEFSRPQARVLLPSSW